MSRWKDLARRARGDEVFATKSDVAAIRSDVADLSSTVRRLATTLDELNHDVRAGSVEGLPLFLGYAERFRTDADTAVGATEIIDRQLHRLTEQIDRLSVRPTDD